MGRIVGVLNYTWHKQIMAVLISQSQIGRLFTLCAFVCCVEVVPLSQPTQSVIFIHRLRLPGAYFQRYSFAGFARATSVRDGRESVNIIRLYMMCGAQNSNKPVNYSLKERARNNLNILLPLPPGEGWGEGMYKSSYIVRVSKVNVADYPTRSLSEN